MALSGTFKDRLKKLSVYGSIPRGWSNLESEHPLNLPGYDKQFLANLLDSFQIALMVAGADTSIIYVNRAFEEQTGYPSRDLIGRQAPYPWWKRTSRRQLQKLLQCLKEGPRRKETSFIARKGNKKWYEFSSMPVDLDKDNRACIIAIRDVTENKNLIDSMQSYIKHVNQLREKEHENIAHELHEGLLQSLVTLNMSIESTLAGDSRRPESLIPKIIDLQKTLNATVNDIRHISHVLRSGVLNHLGLVGAVENLVDEIEDREQAKIDFSVAGIERPLPSNIETTLYLIAQEALKNAEKHSQASLIKINLRFNSKCLKLSITDNGKGFKVPEKLWYFVNIGKLGLVNMANWTFLLNGRIKVNSGINRGTSISVVVKV
jgi:PAS domain S-box-containing protein